MFQVGFWDEYTKTIYWSAYDMVRLFIGYIGVNEALLPWYLQKTFIFPTQDSSSVSTSS